VDKDHNHIPRSIGLGHILVVFAGLFHNIMRALHAFSEEILELTVYNTIRENQVSEVWEQFTTDLETMEDNNG
jgi:type I site-specific restriction-modification system R (restriction) subunit